MIKALASTILLILIATIGAAANPAEAPVPWDLYQRLRGGEEITHTLWRSAGPELLPNVAMADEVLKQLHDLDVTMGVEVLRLYTGAGTWLESPDARLELYNILRSVSSMQGLEYYSATRGKMRTLFAQSYVVADPDSLRRLPDQLVSEIPPDSKEYIFQEDLTFGKNVYGAEYRSREEGFLLEYRNLTQMRYYFIPMVKPGASLTVIMVIPLGDDLLFYGAMAAHAVSLFGLERSREESFYNRLDALYGWYVREVEARLQGQ